MTDRTPAAVPSDPHAWRESVLSTRSLSYISTDCAFGGPGIASRSASYAQMYPRPQSTMDEQSEDELEMRRDRQSASTVPASVAQSLLFALPQEIRDRIYTFCLASSALPVIEYPRLSLGDLQLAPQLLRTCKAIYAEAAPLLYSGNAFSFAHPSDANVFVRAITSPLHAGLIGYVNLHLRAQDLRLWMPYLTSSSKSRSLKTDFPNLKELIVFYKSTKWQHSHPVDANMRNWCEDKNLDEVIDGLRNAFYHKSAAKDDAGHDIYDEYVDSEDQVMSSPRHSTEESLARSRLPTIKVVCMCRVSLNHFLALTSNDTQNNATPLPPPPAPAVVPAFHTAVFIPQVIQQAIGMGTTPSLAEEGEEFHGFTVADLRGRAKRVWEMNSQNTTSALVARTVFADRRQILLALEVFAYEHGSS